MNVAAQLDSPRRLWLRVEDFLLLNESGAFSEVAKTELIDGEIICTNARFQRHSYAKTELILRLGPRLADIDKGLVLLSEVAVAIPPHDMPEPDLVVIRGPVGTGPVACAAAVLIVEIAETTRDNDLGRKAALYARAGIPEYWVVDLQNGEVVRHSQPDGQAYAARDVTPFGTKLASATLPALVVATGGLG